MNSRYKYLIKNTTILTISSFSSKLLSFFLVPLYTGILTTAEYGILNIITTTVFLVIPIVTLNIVQSVMRYSMEQTTQKNEVAHIGLKYLIKSSLIVGIALLTCHTIRLIPSIYNFELYIFLYFFTNIFHQFLIQFTKGIERVLELGISGIITTFVALIANILLLVVWQYGMKGFLLAQILSSLVGILFLSLRIKFWNYLRDFHINKILEKEMLHYSTPLIANAVGWWVNSASDKYIVTYLIGTSANGLLSVSYKIPTIISVIESIYSQAWQISAIKEYNKSDSEKFYFYMFFYQQLMMILSCSLLILLTKPLAYILFSKDFYVAWQYVPLLLCSNVISSASGFIGAVLSAKKDSKTMAKSTIIGALSNIIFNTLLIYYVGIQGATIATLISTLIIFFIRRNSVKNLFKPNTIIKLLILWTLIVLQSVFEIYIPNYYIQILIILIILFIQRDTLTQIFKSILLRKA